jgi:hypothetical protein
MIADKRKMPRRAMHHPALVLAGDARPLKCLLADISESGARLKMQAGEELPDSFMLQLGDDRAPHRQCHVVWRQGGELGIRFERPLKPKPKSKFRRTNVSVSA